MKTIKSLEQAYKLAEQQVTAQDLLNGRMYVKGEGWSSVKLDAEFREKLIQTLSGLFGGHTKTKKAILWTLTYDKPQHWGLGRVVVEKYGDKPAFLSYIAGQDATFEYGLIRKYLAG